MTPDLVGMNVLMQGHGTIEVECLTTIRHGGPRAFDVNGNLIDPSLVATLIDQGIIEYESSTDGLNTYYLAPKWERDDV